MILKQSNLTDEQFAKLAAFLASPSNLVNLSEHRRSRGFEDESTIRFARLIRSEPEKGSRNLEVVLEVTMDYRVGPENDPGPRHAIPDSYFLDLIYILQGDALRPIVDARILR